MFKSLTGSSFVNNSNRLWQLDFIKGIAIIGVIFYHFVFDLVFFDILSVDLESWPLWIIGRLSASIFIFISGLSFGISYLKKISSNSKYNFSYLIPRFIKLFSCGLAITVVSYFISPQEIIFFGILHFLAIAPLICYFFLDSKYLTILFSIIIFLLMPTIQAIKVNYFWLLWFGIEPKDFATLDYFPLVPWLGLYMLGLFFCQIYYKNMQRQFKLNYYIDNPIINFFSFIGQYTLVIYLLHQPILFILLKIYRLYLG